ncbi:FAD-binding oxidoreductase [bacterium]|nr:FAD-binding oxidoreductase [bacterium]
MKKYIRKRTAAVFSLLAALLILIGAKITRLASAPDKNKDCDFIYPNDSDKPTTITILPAKQGPLFEQEGGFTNDASCLNKTPVYGIVKVSSVADVKNALEFARDNNLKITPSGLQHSMGGQSFLRNGLVLNMKGFKEMKLDKASKTLTVESGAVWKDIQTFLDKEGLAVKAMQSINIFTVGGTLSVNAHGIAHNPGPVAPTVKAMRVMLGNGEIVTASPTENVELFKSVLGGYGLFGVILDVDFEVVDNEMYALTRDVIDYKDFPEFYAKNVENNDQVGLFFGRLSVSPSTYLKETIVQRYTKANFEGDIPSVSSPQHNWLARLIINFSKTGSFGRWVRWALEEHVDPSLYLCSRNEAMSQKEVCLISRNQGMYDPMGYLKNKLKDTDILQEYFIPHKKMPEFVDGLRKIVSQNGANLLNVTIRVVSKDTITALPYAKENMFAFVLYFNQKFNEADSQILRKTTTDLIDMATDIGGTYYLPYQLYYSKEQLAKAYPEIDEFFEAKRKFDPLGVFSNGFWERYSKN